MILSKGSILVIAGLDGVAAKTVNLEGGGSGELLNFFLFIFFSAVE